MNRKGQNAVLMMVFEMIIVGMVIFLSVSFAKELGESETVTRVVISKDIKMMIDTIAGVPGDVVVEYPLDMSNYTVTLLQGEIILNNKGTDFEETRIPFYIPQSHQIQQAKVEEGRLCLSKLDRVISIRSCEAGEVSTLEGACFPLAENSVKSDLKNFGERRNGGERCHVGNDIFTKPPGEVVAISNGEVTFVGRFKTCTGSGNWGLIKEGLTEGVTAQVLVYHPSLDITVNYGEVDMNKVAVKKGDQVLKGQVLGIASYCEMLHFETYQGEQNRNIRWIPSGKVGAGKHACVTNYISDKDPKILDPQSVLSGLTGVYCQPQQEVIG